MKPPLIMFGKMATPSAACSMAGGIDSIASRENSSRVCRAETTVCTSCAPAPGTWASAGEVTAASPPIPTIRAATHRHHRLRRVVIAHPFANEK